MERSESRISALAQSKDVEAVRLDVNTGQSVQNKRRARFRPILGAVIGRSKFNQLGDNAGDHSPALLVFEVVPCRNPSNFGSFS